MATSQDATQATENNRKLFRRYGKMFALADPNVYTSHADKLSLWLNDFKAYYTSARPEIVKLLLIAQVTLRRALGLPEHLSSPFNISEYSEHPMVKSYINLVKTVEPFEHCFTEPSLLAHIRSSLALVSQHAPGSNQPTTHLQSDIQTHSHISDSSALPTSYVSETQITKSSSNTMASAPNILPVVTKAQVKAKKRKAVDFDLLVQRDIKALLEKQGTQGDPSQHVTEDSMVTLKSLRDPQLCEKTSSVIEFQHISAQDVCEDRKMTLPDSITDSLPYKDMPASAESQGTSPPVCEDQKMADPDQIMEPLPVQDFVAVEPQGTSPPCCEDQRMATPEQFTEPLPTRDTSVAAEPQDTSPTSEDQIMAAPDHFAEHLLSQDTTAAVEPQLPTSKDQIMAAPDQIAEPLLSQNTSPATEPQGTSAQVGAEDREITPPDSVTGPSILQPQDYSSQTITRDQEVEAGDTAEASLRSLDAGVAIKPQNSSWQPITEEKEKQKMAGENSGNSASLPSQKPSSSIETQGLAAVMSISEENVTGSLQPSLQNLNPLVSSNHVGNISSPVQDDRPLTPPASADNLVIRSPCSTIPACHGKFGQDMRIVAYEKGLRKDCTMSFTFTVSSALFPKVSAWLNRNVFSLYIAESLCLSLGCYSIADLQEEPVQNNFTPLEQKISVARSYWPQRGGLSMNVQFKNERKDLPLSPPFQVTSDGLVDVSQFLSAGDNVIKLKQTTDMSQYIFVLHSHNPTRAQLHEIDERRRRDEEWQDWVRHVSRPFDILSNHILQT